jgi:hypothetical protein
MMQCCALRQLNLHLANVLGGVGLTRLLQSHISGLPDNGFLISVGVNTLEQAALQYADDARRGRGDAGIFVARLERDLIHTRQSRKL